MNCIKSLRLRFAIKALERAKLNAYRRSIGLEPLSHCSILSSTKRCLKLFTLRVLCCCLQWRLPGTSTTASNYLLTGGTCGNGILKGVVGMLGGMLLILCLVTPILEEATGLAHPKRISALIGLLVGLALGFSWKARLLAFLIAPQMFTNQARLVLLAYALALSMSGPGSNYVKNLEILTNSIHICMDMLNDSFGDIIDLVRNPMSAIASFFKTLKTDIEQIFREFKAAFVYLRMAIVSVGMPLLGKLLEKNPNLIITTPVEAIKSAYNWLQGVTEMCNMEFGTPYDRCKEEFEEAALDCVEQLGESLSFMCHVDALDDLCELTKIVDIICLLPNLMRENVFKPIQAELEKILDTIKQFFDARIHASYDLDMDVNASKSVPQILNQLKADILNEMSWLLSLFHSLDVIAALTFVATTVGSALYYRYWYLNSDHHDNKYITRGMVRLDLERMRAGRDGIFPLKFNEAEQYVQVWSLGMLPGEKKKLKRNFLLIFLSLIPILSYICLDAGLYSLLSLIEKHGTIRMDVKETIGAVNISGDGFMADVDRTILKALQHLQDALPALDTSKCLPRPLKPNYAQYVFIALILLACFILLFTEAYGLRCRQYICSVYYPERQVARDRWLYIHILSSRGSFFKFARQQILAKLGKDEKGFQVGLLQRFIHTCPGARRLFWFMEMRTPEKQCILCGKSGDLDDQEDFHQCPTCSTVLCSDCFQQVEQNCPLCNVSMELESIDEETGSDSVSEDDDDWDDERPLLRAVELGAVNWNKFSPGSPKDSHSASGTRSSSSSSKDGLEMILQSQKDSSSSEEEEEVARGEGDEERIFQDTDHNDTDKDDRDDDDESEERSSSTSFQSDLTSEWEHHLQTQVSEQVRDDESGDASVGQQRRRRSVFPVVASSGQSSSRSNPSVCKANRKMDGYGGRRQAWRKASENWPVFPTGSPRRNFPLYLTVEKNEKKTKESQSVSPSDTSATGAQVRGNNAGAFDTGESKTLSSSSSGENWNSSEEMNPGGERCHYEELENTFYRRYDKVLDQMVKDYPDFQLNYSQSWKSDPLDKESGSDTTS